MSSEAPPRIPRFPIEPGHVHVFAAAIGDTNLAYQVADGAVSVPPTFTIAAAHFDPDYPLRPHPGQRWFGSGARSAAPGSQAASASSSNESERGGFGPPLHAEQHFELHRPLVVGEVLSVRSEAGASWEKEGSTGRLLFSESITLFVDGQGQPVVTSTSVTVRTQLGGPR